MGVQADAQTNFNGSRERGWFGSVRFDGAMQIAFSSNSGGQTAATKLAFSTACSDYKRPMMSSLFAKTIPTTYGQNPNGATGGHMSDAG